MWGTNRMTHDLGILGGRDLFQLWRLFLCTTCAVYAAVVSGRSLWRMSVYLSGSGRTVSLIRSYVIVQLLRLRLHRFIWEFLQIGFWLAILLVLLSWHI